MIKIHKGYFYCHFTICSWKQQTVFALPLGSRTRMRMVFQLENKHSDQFVIRRGILFNMQPHPPPPIKPTGTVHCF